MLGYLTVLATNNPSAAPYAVGIGAGFVVGAFGHITKSSLVILLGILVIGLTTALWVIAVNPTLG